MKRVRIRTKVLLFIGEVILITILMGIISGSAFAYFLNSDMGFSIFISTLVWGGFFGVVVYYDNKVTEDKVHESYEQIRKRLRKY